MEETKMQLCTFCNESKPKTEYSQRRKECKECRNKKFRVFYEQHKEEILEKKKEYREANKEKVYGKCTCVCGAIVCCKNLQIHTESQKHKNKVENIHIERKQPITYYDELNNNKKVFIYVQKQVFDNFQKIRGRETKSNYKILKDMKMV